MSGQKSRKHFFRGLDFFFFLPSPIWSTVGSETPFSSLRSCHYNTRSGNDGDDLFNDNAGRLLQNPSRFSKHPKFLSFFSFFWVWVFFVVASIQIPSSFFPLAECASASPPGDTKVEQYNIPLVLRGPFKRQSKKRADLENL